MTNGSTTKERSASSGARAPAQLITAKAATTHHRLNQRRGVSSEIRRESATAQAICPSQLVDFSWGAAARKYEALLR
jgi:hypothetical protein